MLIFCYCNSKTYIIIKIYIYFSIELANYSDKKLLFIIETVLYCFLLQIILCYFNRHISKFDLCKGRLLGNEISLFL